MDRAARAFLSLKTTKSFFETLEPSQRTDFVRHLKKYLSIYLPSAGFEICSTDRFPGPKSESCVIANRTFRAGEVLNCLSGTIVAMTQEEEDYYENEHDFSILHSSRLDAMCLFLGPARFVNHDCNPNGTFLTQGSSIAITTIKPISIGDEITVFYSPDYFGPGNAECLCETCKEHGRGGYRSEHEKSESQALLIRSPDVHTNVPQAMKLRNQVQAIEIAPRKERPNGNLSGSVDAMMTPPISELSLDDPKSDDHIEYIDLDDYPDVTYIYSSAEEGLEADEMLINVQKTTNPDLSAATRPKQTGITTHDQANTTDTESEQNESFTRRNLRPRKTNCDYNLKRQSLLSLVPQIQDSVLVRKKSRSPRKAGLEYCEVCDDELPKEAQPARIWSQREALGFDPLICRRCERHSKLYKDAWPNRTPVTIRRDSLSQKQRSLGIVRTPSSKASSPRRSTIDPAPVVNTLEGLEDHEALRKIESAKVQLKQGSIIIPRLSNAVQAPIQSGDADLVTEFTSQERCSELVSPTKPHLTLLKCQLCQLLFCKCRYDSEPAAITNSVQHRHPLDKRKVNIVPSRASLSPDAKLVVKSLVVPVNKSPKKSIDPDIDDIYSFASAHEGEKRVYPAFKKRTLAKGSLKIDPTTLMDKLSLPSGVAALKSSTKSSVSQHLMPSAHNARNLGNEGTITSLKRRREDSVAESINSQNTAVSQNKRRSAGSWFYVEVESSESEDVYDLILPTRTRSSKI